MVINWVRTSWQVVDADFTINENFGLVLEEILVYQIIYQIHLEF